jgi:hypothetical protein
MPYRRDVSALILASTSSAALSILTSSSSQLKLVQKTCVSIREEINSCAGKRDAPNRKDESYLVISVWPGGDDQQAIQ